jgi:hypothetical protein
MFLYTAPTCFGPFGPSSGSTHENLAKVTFSLKYQLKHFVKIVVEWQMKISVCSVFIGCCVACHTARAFVGKIILYCEVRKVDNDDDHDLIIKFNSCLSMCRVNSQLANYRNGTSYKH